MKTSKLQNVITSYDPLDLIEDIIISNDWDYERDSNKNIHVEVGGEWCDYQLSFGLNEEIGLLYISCALDIKIPDYRVKDINDLADVMHKAFEVATTGRPGPVLVDIPKD